MSYPKFICTNKERRQEVFNEARQPDEYSFPPALGFWGLSVATLSDTFSLEHERSIFFSFFFFFF